ncbi:multiubiquitin domain-containing protein [Devosia sediminis]|uniref:Multiubiquitin domain-containing protein n=1 Tax=Devosia sediminis TaxID=2798801 RepID=A0A934MN50_9HYPH|nr:multiubiquitin domain-containing protein [Devosia sediminis]MBJ3786406.1 multiubiquitin domain-containing protein [Devosia sediminis]
MIEIENSAALARGSKKTTISVAGTDLVFRPVQLETDTPTGGQIAKASGFSDDQQAHVLQWREDNDLEDLRLHEEANLSKGTRFIVAQSSGTDRITINGDRVDWPAPVVSGAIVRKLGGIPPDDLLFLERQDKPDRSVIDDDLIPIEGDGVEAFKSRKAVWELSVQGVKITSNVPEIVAADALLKAGFEDAGAWIIVLKVEGQPKRQLAATDKIDLRTPGIEKIRLTPKQVDNGEARTAPRRDFDILPVDSTYLDNLGFAWETILEGGHRWLLIADYAVPAGYQASAVQLALLVPPTYPQAEIDMFYVYPPLARTDGGAIPNLMQQVIGGITFQTWSRHRGQGAVWNPRRDNVVTHLALVESAIAKEVGE